MRVTTLETVAGRVVEDTLGVVRGTVLWSRGLKKFSRGGIRSIEYTSTDDMAEGLNKARADAEADLIRQASALGADAIVGVRFEIAEMGAGMFCATATGTAVKPWPCRHLHPLPPVALRRPPGPPCPSSLRPPMIPVRPSCPSAGSLPRRAETSDILPDRMPGAPEWLKGAACVTHGCSFCFSERWAKAAA
ncbi:MAG: heavy metal-binding domain-containing protein [Hyphomicrobiales bacterium]